MKKFLNYFLSFFTMAAILFLASCTKDNPLPSFGTLSISTDPSDSVSAAPGDTVDVMVTFTGVAEGTEATVTSNPSGTFLPDNRVATGDTVHFVVPSSATAGDTYTLTFTIQGDNAQETTQVDVNVTVNVAAYTAVLLEAPVGQGAGQRTSKTFFSADNGATYSVDEVVAGTNVTSADIDFGYYYGQANEATLASPAAYPESVYNLGPNGANWGTRNETLFRSTTLTSADFGAFSVAQGDDIAGEFEVGSSETQEISHLAVDQVYAFKTADGRYGLLRIDEVNPGIESNKYITISVKVTNI